MTDIIRVDKTILSWNSCSIKIDGIPWNGITAFDYEEKRERKVVYGMRRDGTPLGKTAGKYSVPACNMTMLRDSWDKLTSYLTIKGLGSYGDAFFSLVVQYVEPLQPPTTIIATDCTIDGAKDANQEGTDELLTEVTIGALTLTRNGKRLWSLLRGLP